MSPVRRLRRAFRRALRRALAGLPRDLRFAIIRAMIDCDPQPDPRLSFKIAETEQELEDCFRLLHDAYVASGYMVASPSGLRVTIYHALPTTTTLCAKFDGRVIGTITIIRDGAFGFPMQSAFDLSPVRARGGNIAEISALAIDPAFRRSQGAVLFPLVKFMYGYCRDLFDTHHLVIAVNPKMIELYEALLFFERLPERPVDRYAFANGAPAVGATLDLRRAPEVFKAAYDGRPPRRNLYRYFVDVRITGIQMPARVMHLTNDPVLTPQLLDHFFNRRTQVFSALDAHQRLVLRSVYPEAQFRPCLPEIEPAGGDAGQVRRHRRFTIRCPATLRFERGTDAQTLSLTIVDVSHEGCRAESDRELAAGAAGEMTIEWGAAIRSQVASTLMRHRARDDRHELGFHVTCPDPAWHACVHALRSGVTAADLSRLAEVLLRPAATDDKTTDRSSA
jgi:GNAT superfamily N-acetyltransferase